MNNLKALFLFLILGVSLASFAAASEPDWQGLIGNSTINLAGSNGGNLTCPFIGLDPNCGKYAVGFFFIILFIAFCLIWNIPSEASLPLGILLVLFISNWGWIPISFEWMLGSIGGIIMFLILYRFIGG